MPLVHKAATVFTRGSDVSVVVANVVVSGENASTERARLGLSLDGLLHEDAGGRGALLVRLAAAQVIAEVRQGGKLRDCSQPRTGTVVLRRFL